MAVSSCWMRATLIMLVLPVPDCACAMTSRPPVMGRIARCWMADGFSKPASAADALVGIPQQSTPSGG